MLTLLTTLALTASPSLSLPLERYTLPNGLTVILHEDHARPQVVVNVYFAVGSADEKKGRTGFAHLFEHLMFMGTRNVPNGGFDSLMEQLGGSNNAFTNYDQTDYFESGPSNLLETFLWLEADRLAHLPDDMTKAKVDLQRDVVKNERRQSYENRPYGKAELIIDEKLFPAGHPYAHTVIGSHADLTAASVEDVKAFFRANYVPTNASLVVAGDFKAAEAKALIEKTLGALPRVEAPPRVDHPLVELKKPVRVDLKDDVQEARVIYAWVAPPSHTPGTAELDVLSTVLAFGKSSRLVKHLVTEQRVAEDVDVSFEERLGQGIFRVTITGQGGRSAAELEKAVDAELAQVFTAPITAAEVERAKAQTQTQLLQRLEDLNSRAVQLNLAQMQRGDPGSVARDSLARYEDVDATGVMEAARRMFHAPKLTVTVVPAKAAKGGAR